MATTKEQWKTAFDLLSKFERGLISPEEFKWQYFIDNVGASKPTLWRNEEFNLEFQRTQKLIKQYKTKNIEYSLLGALQRVFNIFCLLNNIKRKILNTLWSAPNKA